MSWLLLMMFDCPAKMQHYDLAQQGLNLETVHDLIIEFLSVHP